MIEIIKALILGVVQGLTEFIPVSSSGHLVVAQHVLNIEKLGLSFDVALHLGTLAALIIVFKDDLVELAKSIIGKAQRKHLAWLIILATIPAVLFGLVLQNTVEGLRSSTFVAFNLIAVALVMLMSEKYYLRTEHKKEFDRLSSGSALTIGLAQAIAIFPGVSRSGATITTGLFNRLSRTAAARFSFLLSAPITFGAALKVLGSKEAVGSIAAQPVVFLVGLLSSFISGYFAIKFLLKFLSKHGLNIFAYYRIAVGVIILMLL